MVNLPFCIVFHTVSSYFSHGTLEDKKFSKEEIEKVSVLLDHDIATPVFESNISSIYRDNIFLFNIMNVFSLWGPRAAVKHVLNNRELVNAAMEKYGNIMNALIILTSSQNINNDKNIDKFIKAQEINDPKPKSKYLLNMLEKYQHQNMDDKLLHSMNLFLYLQSPR